MNERWIRTLRIATFALVLSLACGNARADLLGFLGGGSKPDTTEEWLKARKAEFAKWQTEHPGVNARLAELMTRSNELAAAADAAIFRTPRYTDLIARSRAMSPAQIAKAQEIFLTAFTLWRDGDFKSAEIAFREGLAIDPANGVAHYYLGEILQRHDEPSEAAAEMDKAVALGSGSAESFKARSALKELPPLPDPEVNAPPAIFPATTTPVEIWDCPECPQMVVIPAGRYTMGSPASENERKDDEGPQHRVRVGSFAAGKYEITRGEFGAFVKESGYDSGDRCISFDGDELDERAGHNWQNPGYSQTDSHPVVCVNNMDDAKAYVAWLSRRTGKSYRLLSEAEWEYAARAGHTSPRYWGGSSDQTCTYANFADQMAKGLVPGAAKLKFLNCADSHAYTAPAGSFRPNAFGLYDILGNVWEIVEDCWNDNYNGAPNDGSAWSGGECRRRVVRGGSWSNGQGAVRAANRSWGGSGRSNNSGFRVARMLP